MTGWQPIETAPKTGTILVSQKVRNINTGEREHSLSMAWWRKDIQRWRCGCGWLVEPTHWMPLPAPPVEIGSPEEQV